MQKLLIIVSLLFICCDKPITVEEIVRRCKVCEDNNMKAVTIHDDLWGTNVTNVKCKPKGY